MISKIGFGDKGKGVGISEEGETVGLELGIKNDDEKFANLVALGNASQVSQVKHPKVYNKRNRTGRFSSGPNPATPEKSSLKPSPNPKREPPTKPAKKIESNSPNDAATKPRAPLRKTQKKPKPPSKYLQNPAKTQKKNSIININNTTIKTTIVSDSKSNAAPVNPKIGNLLNYFKQKESTKANNFNESMEMPKLRLLEGGFSDSEGFAQLEQDAPSDDLTLYLGADSGRPSTSRNKKNSAGADAKPTKAGKISSGVKF
jgi:hypothetical protein